MLKTKIISIALMGYSVLVSLMITILRPFAKFSPRLHSQLLDRPNVSGLADTLRAKRKPFRHAVLFFCSSAGEFEQALPLIDRLKKRGDTFVHSLIFSKSGFNYAVARGESSSYSLSPVTDSVWHWGWIFAALRPSAIAVVRHELWPGFLWSAQNYAPVFLLNASKSIGESESPLKRRLRSLLLEIFTTIFTVSERDEKFFRSTYQIAANKISTAGDTKYDRVLERACSDSANNLAENIFSKTTSKRLVVGSAHIADLELILAAASTHREILTDWQVIIAPHHINHENIEVFSSRLTAAGFNVHRYTQGTAPKGVNPLIILDTMGMLAEVYRHAQAAFVGGATHHQVHNVLEPAVHGLALAWGPLYKNSQEATKLVDDKIATVVSSGEQFSTWLHKSSDRLSTGSTNSGAAVKSLCGAADIIFSRWKQILDVR